MPLADVDRPRVLIVDDELGPRESFAIALRRRFEVDTASGAMEAIELIREAEYSAIILDVSMPDIDGLETLSMIRDLDEHVGVLMLTGYGTLNTAQVAMEKGANGFKTKPPKIADLMASIAEQAANTRRKRDEERANAEARTLNLKLKQEIEESTPDVWKGRASVELVHDLANPLTVVTGYSGVIGKMVARLKDPNRELVDQIANYSSIVERAAEYCYRLAQDWREQSVSSENYEDLDLAKLVREIREVVFFENSRIHVVAMGPQLIRGATTELSRVFQNFMRNALEAKSDRVDIRLISVGNTIEVVIQDDGEGMDNETKARAMRGGFTTKEHGLGLGLKICRHILTSHHADYSVDSEVGVGTIVKLVFPARGS